MSIAVTTQIICFSILSLVVIVGALGVILLESIVYSAFLLGGVFMSVAGLYLLLNASFVAAAQVLVYVGAVNVLIIFAIMLVNKKEDLKPIDNIALGRLPTNVTTDPSVKPLRELTYLPKGVMDPHEVPSSDVRVGKLPEEVYDWMKPEVNYKNDPAITPKN